jgi:hypothetical protein
MNYKKDNIPYLIWISDKLTTSFCRVVDYELDKEKNICTLKIKGLFHSPYVTTLVPIPNWDHFHRGNELKISEFTIVIPLMHYGNE